MSLVGRWAGRALLLAASSLLALAVSEAVFRQTAHRIAANGEWFAVGRIIDKADPLLGFSLIPGSTQLSVRGGAYTTRTSVNRLGMHDVEREETVPAGRRRILLLGDSFVFGPGVPIESNVSQVVEREVPGAQVLNAGVPGYNLEQEYLYYLHRGKRHEAALVLLGFFINDLAPARGAAPEEGDGGLPVAYRPAAGRGTGETHPVREWFESRALLWEFARIRARRLAGGRPAPIDESQEARRARTPEAIAFLDPAQDGRSAAAWRRAGRVLDALNAQVRSSGARLAVVTIPAPFQLSAKRWDEWVAWLGMPAAAMRRTGPQIELAAWCERTMTPCLDLIDPLTEAGGEAVYIPHDLHWTVEGHEVAGRAIAGLVSSL